jgi:hypothetical protein
MNNKRKKNKACPFPINIDHSNTPMAILTPELPIGVSQSHSACITADFLCPAVFPSLL